MTDQTTQPEEYDTRNHETKGGCQQDAGSARYSDVLFASDLAEYGEEIIGLTIDTAAIGDYPGGPAKIIRLLGDPGAPEIVFDVEHPTFGEMGIFHWEMVFVISQNAHVDAPPRKTPNQEQG